MGVGRDRRGGRGLEELWCGAGEVKEVLEDRDRQGAPQPRAASCGIFFREGSDGIRMGRGPEDRHIICLLYSSWEGIDTSNNSLFATGLLIDRVANSLTL